MHISHPFPPPRPGFALVLRRSALLSSTVRAVCCLVALSTPYALFVLDKGLHP